MTSLSKAVAIVGADESDEIGIVPHKSTLQLHAEAARNTDADQFPRGCDKGRPTPLRAGAHAPCLCRAPSP